MPDLHLTAAALQRPAWDSGRFKSVRLVSAAAAIQVLLSTISRRVPQACPEMATPACCFRYLLLRQLLRRLGGGLIQFWATAGFTPELTWGPAGNAGTGRLCGSSGDRRLVGRLRFDGGSQPQQKLSGNSLRPPFGTVCETGRVGETGRDHRPRRQYGNVYRASPPLRGSAND